jgi:hypothetical protein
LKQKRRRETQLAAWRAKHAAPVVAGESKTASVKPATSSAKPAPVKA